MSAKELTWTDVGGVDEISNQSARRIETKKFPVGVFKTNDGEIFAIIDECPHKKGPLTEGIVHGKAVACPLHNWSISLETGEAMGADAGKGCTHTIPLKIENGRIFLGLED